MTQNKANYFFIFLIILVVSLFTRSLFFEQIPYHNGAGFDGFFYREVLEIFILFLIMKVTIVSEYNAFSLSFLLITRSLFFPLKPMIKIYYME